MANLRRRDASLQAGADAELALEIAQISADAAAVRAAIGGYGVAREITDLAPLPNEPESVVVAVVFHRAVACGAMLQTLPRHGLVGKLFVGREVRASDQIPDDSQTSSQPRHACSERFGERLQTATGSSRDRPFRCGSTQVTR